MNFLTQVKSYHKSGSFLFIQMCSVMCLSYKSKCYHESWFPQPRSQDSIREGGNLLNSEFIRLDLLSNEFPNTSQKATMNFGSLYSCGCAQ